MNIDELFEKLEKEYNIVLTSQQKEIVKTTGCPLCSIAAPGSGKTLTYVVRIGKLILVDGINPEQILALTFSREAAKEMEKRFLKLFGNMVNGKVHFSTIHSFALKVVREYNRKNALTYTIIEGDDAKENKLKILKDIYKKINSTVPTEEKMEEVANAIGFVKNMMLKPCDEDEINKYRFNIPNFISIYHEYEKYKEQNNYIDYDDMLVMALEILEKDKNMLEKYRRSYTHIQLDEGQDTSKIQHEIVKLLAHPQNNIFLVGDDDQSIYRFRAAFPEELLNFNKTYPNAKVLFMEENFRSTQDIVQTASEFIKNNYIRYKKNIFTRNPKGEPVEIVRLKDDKEQYTYLIEVLKNTGNLSETAILYRNNLSAVSLIERLDREGIPFYIRDVKNFFFSHWVVKDIVSFLDLALNNKDMEAFSRIHNKGLYVSYKMYEYIQKGNPNISIFDRLIDYPYFSNKFQREHITILKWDFYNLAQKTPLKAIEFIENDLGYDKYLKNMSDNIGISYEGAKNIIANMKVIAEKCGTIYEFKKRMLYLEDLVKNAQFNKYKNAVVLSTIHSSKGLEWDNVFLIDLINGEFPNQSSIDKYYEGDPRELEEERRLFYVGMTRARKNLKLIAINVKNNKKVESSLFVKEVDRIIHPEKIENILAFLNKKKTVRSTKKTLDLNKWESKEEKTEEFKSKQMGINLEINSYVNHMKYGKGKVISINKDEDVIKIEFSDGCLRQFKLSLCIERNIIWPVE